MKVSKSPQKIAILLSGGVDSALCLALLKETGYEVDAFYLKIWLEEELDSLEHCPWKEDLTFAQANCDELNVPLEIVSLQSNYRKRIINYMISEYSQGQTPNPDVLCNTRIKFGAFLEWLDTKKKELFTNCFWTLCKNRTK